MMTAIQSSLQFRPGRRSFIIGAASAGLAPAVGCATGADGLPPGAGYFAYVGARTTLARRARGKGINVFRVDARSGAWAHLQLIVDGDNPTFLTIDQTGRYLYAVHGDGSEVCAFSIGDDGRLTLINHQSTQGKNPNHITIDPTNKWVIAPNHSSSTVAVLPRRPDGGLGELTDLVPLTGEAGPWRDEQPYAKPHQVMFNSTARILAVPDKGLDRIFTFKLDERNGKLTPTETVSMKLRRGSGPRHMAFHPVRPLAYLLGELDSSLTAMTFDAATGALTPFQIVSTLPDTFVGESAPSEIQISSDGRFLYLSNRGHDSIGVFSISQTNGRVTPVGWHSTEGRTPRHFAMSPDGRFLFAANEDSDTIVPYSVDKRGGKLVRQGAPISAPSAVCIAFKR